MFQNVYAIMLHFNIDICPNFMHYKHFLLDLAVDAIRPRSVRSGRFYKHCIRPNTIIVVKQVLVRSGLVGYGFQQRATIKLFTRKRNKNIIRRARVARKQDRTSAHPSEIVLADMNGVG